MYFSLQSHCLIGFLLCAEELKRLSPLCRSSAGAHHRAVAHDVAGHLQQERHGELPLAAMIQGVQQRIRCLESSLRSEETCETRTCGPQELDSDKPKKRLV